ncbi:MAG: type VI secretion system ATPase TssH [Pseudomonadota bacterium]
MSQISRVALFGKLNKPAFTAVESATLFCKMRGNPYVELVHWLHQIMQAQDSDLHRIIDHFSLDRGQTADDIVRTLDGLPRGATAISDLSPHLEEAVERGWIYGSLMMDATRVRTGHLLLGVLKTPGLNKVLLGISRQFARVPVEDLADRFAAITAGSPEEMFAATERTVGQPGEAAAAVSAQMGGDDALASYCTDLTESARAGQIDRVVGRDAEIRQVIDVLMRRRQNNPILTGEAGVGKTAVVEGLAMRIAHGDVPPALARARLLSLDVGLLQAGASMKGEFENRLRGVIEEVQASPVPIVLFVDETHTLIGAGGNAGTGDAANLLKPALARGTLRTIGATTWTEYRKHIEKDPALTRRFQVVKVEEPDAEKAVLMMRGVASKLEQHHTVQILDEAIEAAVKLSARYIPARQLPDKSVSVLDTACARVAISLHASPPALEDCRRRIEAFQTELHIIDRDEAAGQDIYERRQRAAAALVDAEERLQTLSARWKHEKALVDEILALRAHLRTEGEAIDGQGAAPDFGTAPRCAPANRATALIDLRAKQHELAELQGDAPMVLPIVDAQVVSTIVADWTGIPVGRMMKDEIATVLNLADHLSKRVIGQDHAMQMIAKRIQASRAGLDNPSKPVGVFLLAGTSGVGKTETALALAEVLYGGDQNVITINMSEYQEAHTVSGLKGAPPGYVGYGEGGVLTEAVRRNPYSVVLLDEVEKAHPDVHEMFFQVFDKGMMEDGEGRMIDFRNTLILLTSNVGSDQIMGLCTGRGDVPDPERLGRALRQPLLEVFPAALLGRMVTIPYYPLGDEMISSITRLQLGRIAERINDAYSAPFTYSDAVVDTIVARCQELESGGRMIDSIVTNTMLPAISFEFLTRTMNGSPVNGVRVDATDSDFTYSFE